MCMVDYAENDGVWMVMPHFIKARKDHRCENCHRVIAKGETYQYAKYLSEGFVLPQPLLPALSRCGPVA